MKKKTRNGKALTLLLGLFLSSLMFSCETINKSKTEDMFSRETKIFYWYADSLNINIPNEKHTFFLVPDYSCSGWYNWSWLSSKYTSIVCWSSHSEV